MSATPLEKKISLQERLSRNPSLSLPHKPLTKNVGHQGSSACNVNSGGAHIRAHGCTLSLESYKTARIRDEVRTNSTFRFGPSSLSLSLSLSFPHSFFILSFSFSGPFPRPRQRSVNVHFHRRKISSLPMKKLTSIGEESARATPLFSPV